MLLLLHGFPAVWRWAVWILEIAAAGSIHVRGDGELAASALCIRRERSAYSRGMAVARQRSRCGRIAPQ